MSDATESVSDAELAWQKSFVFDRHETAAIYKRKVGYFMISSGTGINIRL